MKYYGKGGISSIKKSVMLPSKQIKSLRLPNVFKDGNKIIFVSLNNSILNKFGQYFT